MKETVLLLLNQQIAVNKAKTKIFSKDNADRAFAAARHADQDNIIHRKILLWYFIKIRYLLWCKFCSIVSDIG